MRYLWLVLLVGCGGAPAAPTPPPIVYQLSTDIPELFFPDNNSAHCTLTGSVTVTATTVQFPGATMQCTEVVLPGGTGRVFQLPIPAQSVPQTGQDGHVQFTLVDDVFRCEYFALPGNPGSVSCLAREIPLFSSGTITLE